MSKKKVDVRRHLRKTKKGYVPVRRHKRKVKKNEYKFKRLCPDCKKWFVVTPKYAKLICPDCQSQTEVRQKKRKNRGVIIRPIDEAGESKKYPKTFELGPTAYGFEGGDEEKFVIDKTVVSVNPETGEIYSSPRLEMRGKEKAEFSEFYPYKRGNVFLKLNEFLGLTPAKGWTEKYLRPDILKGQPIWLKETDEGLFDLIPPDVEEEEEIFVVGEDIDEDEFMKLLDEGKIKLNLPKKEK